MIPKLLLGVLVILAGLAAYIATRPDEFRVSRAAILPAPPEAVFALVNDFHRWADWSPWAKIDPQARETFSGPAAGVGAAMAWAGNNDVGEGRMQITLSEPARRIGIRLDFVRPMAATNYVEFTFGNEPDGQSRVTWSMTGRNNFLGKAMSLFVDCDKMVGDQFAAGLADLGRVAAPK